MSLWLPMLERGVQQERTRVIKEIDALLKEGMDDSGQLPAPARYVLRQLRARVSLEDTD